MVTLCKKILLWNVLLDFHILCETVPQLNDNLMTQFNEGKRYQGI